VEIVVVNGEGNALASSEVMANMNRIKCFAVLDGDQSNSTRTDKRKQRKNVFFLPGTRRPEDEIMSSVLDEVSWISHTISVAPDQIFVAIESCKHLDHQYRLKRIAEQIGYPEAGLTQVFMLAFLRNQEIAQGAENIARGIRNFLEGVTA
jgi:hypothetical protein